MAQPDDSRLRRVFADEALPHVGALLRTALRLTRNRQDAEDLVQDTMVKAWRFFDRYEPGTNCKAWLFKILTNTRINQYERQARRPVEADLEAVEATLAAPESVRLDAPTRGELTAFADLLDDEVKAALDAVPEPFRVVLVLAAVEGFAYKEIASVLDGPIGTVMSRLFRARKLLQASLRRYARERGLVDG